MKHLPGTAGMLAIEEHGRGDGIPVVLVHGMAADASFWHTTLRPLSAKHRIYVPELRGHGRSAMPADHRWEISDFADDLASVMADLTDQPVLLVGHSFGASVVLDLAARFPRQVAGVLLFDPAGDFSYVPPEAMHGFLSGLDDDDYFADTVEGALGVALDGAHAETERRVRAAFLTAPRPMVRAMYRSLFAFRPAEAVDAITRPMRIVTAPVNAASFALHAIRPGVPHTALRDVSHWLMMDDPAGAAAVIEEMAGMVRGEG